MKRISKLSTKVELNILNYNSITNYEFLKITKKVESMNLMIGKINKYLGLNIRMAVLRNNMDQIYDMEGSLQQ